MEKIDLTELMDVNILQQIQDGFSGYTRMAAVVTDTEGVPVTQSSGFTRFCKKLGSHSEAGRAKCETCIRSNVAKAQQNGGVLVYCCHAGVTECVSPIMLEGKLVGALIGGQVLYSEIDGGKLYRDAQEMEIDPNQYYEAAQNLPIRSWEEVEQAAEFLRRIAEAVSQMLYRNYTARQENIKMERAIRTQSDFFRSLSISMKKNMREWMRCVEGMAGQVDRKAGERMQRLLAQGMETYSMVEDAVEYIKMSDGKVELSESKYCLRELLEQTAEGAGNHAREAGAEIVIQVEEEVPNYLLGDAGRIGQIVNKLLMNSINHAQKGRITVKASSQKVSYASMLVICIENPQMVITDRQLEIMQKYMNNGEVQAFMGEDSQEWGLSIVGLLIRQMSGKIEVASRQEGGIAVTIILPQLEIKEGETNGV